MVVSIAARDLRSKSGVAYSRRELDESITKGLVKHLMLKYPDKSILDIEQALEITISLPDNVLEIHDSLMNGNFSYTHCAPETQVL